MTDTYIIGSTGNRRVDPRFAAIAQQEPSATLQSGIIALNTRLLANANPWMAQRPDTLMSLAQSGLAPDEIVRNGAAMYGMQNIDALRDSIAGLSPIAQRSVWGRLTESQQRSLDQLGYAPPSGDPSITQQALNPVFGFLGDVVEPVWGAVSNVGGPVVGKALDTLTFIGDQPAHLYRAIRQMDSWQQWVALGGAVAGVALAIPTAGSSLALTGASLGTLGTIGAIGGAGLVGASIAAAATNPVEWWESFNSSWDGERTFSRASQQRARQILGGATELETLARSLALNIDLYETVEDFAGTRGASNPQVMQASIDRVAGEIADPGSSEFESIRQGLGILIQQEPFRRAVDELQQGKISFGRDVIGWTRLEGTPLDSIASGTLDGLWQIVLDPTMAAGWANRAWRAARYGVDLADRGAAIQRITHLYNSDVALRNTFNQVTDAVRTQQYRLMPAAYRKMWNPLNEWARASHINAEDFDADGLLKFFKDGEGIYEMMRGRGSVAGSERLILSTVNRQQGWGRFVAELQAFRDTLDDRTLTHALETTAAKVGIDVTREIDPNLKLADAFDTNLVPMNAADYPSRVGMIGEAVAKGMTHKTFTWVPGVRTFGAVLASITSMVPPNSAIAIVGDKAPDDISRFIEAYGRSFNMPSQVRTDWLNAILRQGNTSQRIEVLQSFLDTGLTIAGMRISDDLSLLADNYLNKVKQAYGLGGLDDAVLEGIPTKSGILPSSHAAAMLAMPDLHELQRYIRRGHIFKHIAKVTDSNFVEASMSRFWKPAVLLRVGFIPRAAGEEMLAWFARMTEGSVGQEFGARSIAMGNEYLRAQAIKSAGVIPASPFEITRMNEALKWRNVTHVRPLEMMASRWGWAKPVQMHLNAYSDWLRDFLETGFGYKLATPELIETSRLWSPFTGLYLKGWWHELALGKANSWRRMMFSGVDPNLNDAASSWIRNHAESVLRGTSALNASVFERAIVNPDLQVVMVPDPRNKSKLVPEPLMVVRGERGRIGQTDPRYPVAVHHRIGESLQDEVLQPIFAKLYPRLFAGIDIDRQAVVHSINASRSVESHVGKMIVGEALQPRFDNVRAATWVMRNVSPDVAPVLNDVVSQGEFTWTGLMDALDTNIAALRVQMSAGDDVDQALAKLVHLKRELDTMTPVIEGLETMSRADRAWLSMVLTSDMANDGRFFDLPSMQRWITGEADVIAKRPTRTWYRGIRNADTIEITPEGDLVMVGQYQDHWDGPAISVSPYPDKTVMYSTQPELGYDNDLPSGATIEIDGDYILRHYGLTMDELRNTRTMGWGQPSSRMEPGPYMLGGDGPNGEPAEVALWLGQHPSVTDLVSDAVQLLPDDDRVAAAVIRLIQDHDLGVDDELFQRFMAASDESGQAKLALAQWDNDQNFDATIAGVERDQLQARVSMAQAELMPIHDEITAKIADWYDALGPERLAAADAPTFRLPAGSWRIVEADEHAQFIREVQRGTDWMRAGAVGDVPFFMPNKVPGTAVSIDSFINDSVGRIDDRLASMSAEDIENLYSGLNYGSPETVQANIEELLDAEDRVDWHWLLQGDGRNRGEVADVLSYRIEVHLGLEVTEAGQKSATQKLLEGFKVRGEGGWGTMEMPTWAPFFETTDEFWTAFADEVWAALQRPENQHWARSSRFAQETADGRRVAHPMQEGMVRLYQPIMRAEGTAVRKLMGGMAPDELAAELLTLPSTYRLHGDYIKSLPIEERQQILFEAATQLQAEINLIPPTISSPYGLLAFDDPRIARWVTDVFSGAAEPEVQALGYLDVGRNVPHGQNIEGTHKLSGPGGVNYYQLGDADAGRVNMIDANGVELADGSWTEGVPYTEAMHDWAQRITKKVRLEHSGGTQERMTIIGEGVGRQIGGTVEPVPVGSTLHAKEDLFVNGEPLNWGHPDFMRGEATTTEKLMWPIVAPMVRDVAERPAGLGRVVPRELRSYVEGENVLVDQSGDPLNFVNMTRSRVDDVHDTDALDLPNIALAEVMKAPHDRLWDRIVRFGFDKVIGPSIDALVRKPMSFHYYASAYRQNMKYQSAFLNRHTFDEVIPEQFADQIDWITKGKELAPSHIDWIREVARHGEGIELPVGAYQEEHNAALAWFLALGDDNTEVQQALIRLEEKANRHVLASTTPEDVEQWRRVRTFANLLQGVDPGPLRVARRSITGAPGEALARMYIDAVPAEQWRNIDSFNAGARDAKLPEVSKTQYETLTFAKRNIETITARVEETAAYRALENVVPFLDSHEQRTQFADMARNLLPFWYAEENFLKRWARTLSLDGTYGLATLRKGQLLYMGMRSAGIVRTDTNGRDWFVYPGSGVLTDVLGRLPFVPDTLPVGVMFQASTDSLLPGVNERFGTPSVSPWAALPIDAVTSMFPDATPLRRAVLGDVGATRGALNQFVPTQVRNIWEAAFGNEESSVRYASAMMTAAAMLEANDKGLPEHATPAQLDDYMRKLRNHARIIMWGQALTGFVVPGAPSAIVTGEDAGSFGWLTGLGVDSPDQVMSASYRRYVEIYGIEEGTRIFLDANEWSDMEDVVNPLAFTVPQGTSVSGAPLPATKTGLAWYEEHQGWIDEQPEAGAWFLPPAAGDDAFDQYAYNQQIVSGLRKRQNPTDFMRAMIYREGADAYFEARNAYEEAAATIVEDPVRKQLLDDAWETWSQIHLAAHPIFAEELVSGEGKQRRARAIEQLRYAVTDPKAPPSPHTDAIRELSQNFDLYSDTLRMLNESRSAESRQRVRFLKQGFQEWVASWTLRNPDLEQLWSAVYQPEAALTGTLVSNG